MDSYLSTFGWSGLDSCSISNKTVVFSEEGILVNENTYLTSENNVEFAALFASQPLDMGLVLWYNNEIGYIRFVLSANGFALIRVYNGNEVQLKYSAFADNGIAPPANDPSVGITLSARIQGSNIKCYYEQDLVFNVEDNTFKDGVFGVYGTNGVICMATAANCAEITGWSPFAAVGAGAIPQADGSVLLKCPRPDTFSSVLGHVTTVVGETYTISIRYKGSITLSVTDSNFVDFAITSGSSEEESVLALTFVAIADGTGINITALGGTAMVSKPMVEHRGFATTYTESSRDDGYVSFPTENMDQTKGGLSLWVVPVCDYQTGTLPIFYYNDTFKMVYTGGNFVLTYGAETLSVAHSLEINKAYHIIVTWLNGADININIYDGTLDTIGNKVISTQDMQYSDSIVIGSDPNVVGNLTVDTLVIYAGQIAVEDMKTYRTEPIPEDNRIVVKTDFSNKTLEFSRNKIVIPNPKPGTPIITEDEDGRVYERVYFVDQGKYVVYKKTKVPYNGTKTFVIEHDNIMGIRAYDNDNIYSNITVSGSSITINDLTKNDVAVENELLTEVAIGIYKSANRNWIPGTVVLKTKSSDGSYQEVDGGYGIDHTSGTAFFNIAPDIDELYASYTYGRNSELTLQYTPVDVFCVNYNREANGYEIGFSNIYGKQITITYENDFGAETKLATTVEANPFKSANNNGFLYLTQTPVPVTSLDVKVTPDALVADGYQIATITVDCIGANGVPTSNASIVITGARYGTVEKYVSAEEQEFITAFEAEKALHGEEAAIEKYGYFVTDEHMAGRYIYKYKVNNISIDGEYAEKLVVMDSKTNMGIEVPIRIVSRKVG